jgi:trk system potassium uptake protein TrkH
MARINRNMISYIGLLLHTAPAMAGAGALVAMAFGQWPLLIGFGVMILVGGGLGQLLWRSCRTEQSSCSGASMMAVAISWLLLSGLSAIPFYLAAGPYPAAGHFADPFNAWFEAISGVTSTGLTVSERPELLPEGLQFWRSLLEWIGGAGLVLMVLALIEKVEDDYALYQAEARSRRIGDDVADTVRRIWWIYLAFTAGAIGLMLATGLDWWAAINHGLTGIATGGFTIQGESFAVYGAATKLAMVGVMVLGAISFSVHYALLRHRDVGSLLRPTQMKTFWCMWIAGTTGLLAVISIRGGSAAWIDVLFNWTSAVTTCGFRASNHTLWPSGAVLLLVFAMFIGGSAGSTAGGVKLRRVGYLLKGVLWRMRTAWLRQPDQMVYRLDGRDLDEDEVVHRLHSAGVSLALFLITLIVGTFTLLLVLPTDVPLETALFEAASALSSVGLSSGMTSPRLAWQGKLVLGLLMWMGRLEIMSVFILLAAPIQSTTRLTSRLAQLPVQAGEEHKDSPPDADQAPPSRDPGD